MVAQASACAIESSCQKPHRGAACGELIDVLATQLQVPRAHVIAAMRDGASVNGCALRAVKALYPKMFEVTCFSHNIDLVGSRFEVPTLQQHGRACVRPGIDYFLQKFNLRFYKVVRAFKAARYACPMRIQELQPAPAELDALRSFPFLDNDKTIVNLQRELP